MRLEEMSLPKIKVEEVLEEKPDPHARPARWREGGGCLGGREGRRGFGRYNFDWSLYYDPRGCCHGSYKDKNQRENKKI
jgi:hypothetical protein